MELIGRRMASREQRQLFNTLSQEELHSIAYIQITSSMREVTVDSEYTVRALRPSQYAIQDVLRDQGKEGEEIYRSQLKFYLLQLFFLFFLFCFFLTSIIHITPRQNSSEQI